MYVHLSGSCNFQALIFSLVHADKYNCLIQMVDKIAHYYQNNVPMRFGVIFMSSRIVNKIETQAGHSSLIGEGDEEEDVSELVGSLPPREKSVEI
jgi:hypothetical protein